MSRRTVVFDAYGTLFDVTAAARNAAAAHPRLAAQEAELSRIWREKQIGYSWWRAVTGDYIPFRQVTENALDYALEATGLAGDAALRTRLIALYDTLDAYPEVPAMLETLRETGHRTAILSNGSPDMLVAATVSAGLTDLLDTTISVHPIATFKPAARVYDLVEQQTGAPRDAVLFVSSNGWDAAAATGYGFATAWVNRTGLPPDRLPYTPAHTIADLTQIPRIAAG